MGRGLRLLVPLLALLLLVPAPAVQAHGHGPEDIYITDAGLQDPVEDVYLGVPVTWHNDATLPRQVSDAFGVFDSGVMLPGGSFEWHSAVAGTFPYTASFPLLGLLEAQGTLTVRPVFAPLPNRGTTYRMQWGQSDALPEGAVFEVQRRENLGPHNWKHGRWIWWSKGTQAGTGRFVYRCNTGSFGIRVRVRLADGTRSGWAASDSLGCIP
jgi:hypothetical protein